MRWPSLRRFVRRETFTFGRTAWIVLRAVVFAAGGVILCAVTGWLVRVGPDAGKRTGQFSAAGWRRFVAWLPDRLRVVPEGVQWWAAHLREWLQALWSWLGFPPKPLQTLLLAFAGVVVWYLWRELRRPVLMIEPFDVPKELAEAGLSPRVVASWIGTALPELKRSTVARSSSAAKVTYAHHSLPDIQIPEAKIGLRAIIEFLRDIFGWHVLRIGGDIVEIGDGWTVTVYESWGRNQIRVGQESVQKSERDKLIKKATELALKADEPFLFGALMLSRGRSEEALKVAREMALDDPEAAERMGKKAARDRRVMGHLLWSYILTQQKEYEEALKHIELALHLDRRSARAYNTWGILLHAQGLYAGAIEKYKRATTLDPKYTAAYYNWGGSLAALPAPDHGAAIKKFQRATILDPKDADAYCNWGNSLAALPAPDHRAAIKKYERAITLDPKNAIAYCNWANSHYYLGEYQAAIKKYEKATALDPNYAVAYNNWGLALAALPEPDHQAAIKKYERATDLDPKNAAAYCSWGTSLAALPVPDHRGAIEKYEKATTLDPKNAAAYYNWGNSHYKLGEYQAAIEKYERAITLDPKDADAYYICAVALVRLDRIAEAKYMLKKAVEHGMKKEEMAFWLRELLDEDDEPDEAK